MISNEHETEALVGALSKQLSPVRRLARPLALALRWFAVAVLCIAVPALLIGMRQDVLAMHMHWHFVLRGCAYLLLAFFCAVLAFSASIPSEQSLLRLLWLPSALLMLTLLSVIFWTSNVGDDMRISAGMPCTGDTLLFAVAPGLLLFFFVSRAAPLKLRLVAFLGAIASAALSAFGVHMLCANDGFLHVLIWHFGPVLLVGALAASFGERMLKRLRK